MEKLQAKQASEIVPLLGFDAAVTGKFDASVKPADYVALLTDEALYPEAVQFLAAALPKREAVWWACLCARSAMDEWDATMELPTLTLAEQWVYEPKEERRRPALAAAEAAGLASPAALAASAVFWSGGSIAPEDTDPVDPPPMATAQSVAGAVILAASGTQPEEIPEHFRFFIEQGLAIAAGGSGMTLQQKTQEELTP